MEAVSNILAAVAGAIAVPVNLHSIAESGSAFISSPKTFRLLRSKFVLWPNRDYIWSYRFFETVMSGAIPIVEEDGAYERFDYFRMSVQHLRDPAKPL